MALVRQKSLEVEKLTKFSIEETRGFRGDDYDNENLPNCLIHPANIIKMHWDILMCGVLLFSCIATPVQIALWDDLDRN